MIPQDRHLHVLLQLLDGVDIGVSQVRAPDVGLDDGSSVGLHTTTMQQPARGRIGSPELMPWLVGKPESIYLFICATEST